MYNSKIDCTRSLSFGDDTKNKNSMKDESKVEKDSNKNLKDNKNYNLEYEEICSKDFEYFFPVLCKECENQLGVYDVEGKVFHLFNVLPSIA